MTETDRLHRSASGPWRASPWIHREEDRLYHPLTGRELSAAEPGYDRLRALATRGDEIDRYTARTFINWLNNWDEERSFYGGDWSGKHNNGVATHMPALMLDLPIHRASTIYNWRETPVITRERHGTTTRNDVIYHTRGFTFHG